MRGQSFGQGDPNSLPLPGAVGVEFFNSGCAVQRPMRVLESNPAVRAVLLTLHPGDVSHIEKSMLSSFPTGYGRASKVFTGTVAGRVAFCADAPSAAEVDQGWWPHVHTLPPVRAFGGSPRAAGQEREGRRLLADPVPGPREHVRVGARHARPQAVYNGIPLLRDLLP